jgi:hypothetical protein
MVQIFLKINGVNINKKLTQKVKLFQEIKLVKDCIHKELSEIQEKWEPKLPKVVCFFQMDK